MKIPKESDYHALSENSMYSIPTGKNKLKHKTGLDDKCYHYDNLNRTIADRLPNATSQLSHENNYVHMPDRVDRTPKLGQVPYLDAVKSKEDSFEEEKHD